MGINDAKVQLIFLIASVLRKKTKKMKYTDFEYVLSPERMGRYLQACGDDSQKAMTLYRYNLQLSQEMFTVISCFEVALRNAIDRHFIHYQ